MWSHVSLEMSPAKQLTAQLLPLNPHTSQHLRHEHTTRQAKHSHGFSFSCLVTQVHADTDEGAAGGQTATRCQWINKE